jgi:hypothetical protein
MPESHLDELIPDPQVWKMFGISSMTGWRWTHDPVLGFPPAIKIRTRNFRSRAALEAWREKMVHEGARGAKVQK